MPAVSRSALARRASSRVSVRKLKRKGFSDRRLADLLRAGGGLPLAGLVQAIDTASRELKAVRDQIPSSTPEQIAAFIDTHLLMLEDRALSSQPIHLIRNEGLSAEWALQQHRDTLIQVFEQMEDPFLRTRRDDIDHVVNRIVSILLEQHQSQFEELRHQIVLAEDLSPADVILLRNQDIAGFVTDYGGPMSHTAILARSLGIPAVCGLGGEVPSDSADGQVHLGEAPGRVVRLLAVDADVADVAAMDDHTGGTDIACRLHDLGHRDAVGLHGDGVDVDLVFRDLRHPPHNPIHRPGKHIHSPHDQHVIHPPQNAPFERQFNPAAGAGQSCLAPGSDQIARAISQQR